MSFKDFINNFQWLQVGKCNDDYSYEYTQCSHPVDGFCLQRVKISKTGPMTFSLAQQDKRCFPRKSDYNYKFCRLILLKIGGNKLEYVAGASGQPNRDLTLDIKKLKPGEYYLYAECDWKD